jgi:cytochrome c-type biogenesis protein CcmH
MKKCLALVFLLAALGPAAAVQPDEVLKDPELETRARHISAGLRCLVCQNQSIDDSDAGVARDLRILIREQLQQGRSDGEVVDFVVARYGDFVLLKPRFKAGTLVLWLAPFLILAVALGLAFRTRNHIPPAPLSEAERDAIAALEAEDGAVFQKPPQN